MSILSYSFSEKGFSHEKSKMPCQDASVVAEIGSIWHLAVVADGIGSCKNSDKASEIAVKAVCSIINKGFPYNGEDEDILALVRTSMHWAANAIEVYVQNENANIKDYQTTLAIALYDGVKVFYGNAGDSGIVALDEFGEYHVLTKKQNNEYDEVIPLYSRKFEVGKTDFNVAAVFCMTDGILDWVVPKVLEKWKYPVHVDRAGLLVNPSFWDQTKKPLEISEYRDAVIKTLHELIVQLNNDSDSEEFGSLRDGNLKDDLSAAVLINTDADLSPEEILFEQPPEPTIEEIYSKKWHEFKNLYPSYAKESFIKYVRENNPNMTEEEILNYVEKITGEKVDTVSKKKDTRKSESEKPEISSKEVEVTKNQEDKSFIEKMCDAFLSGEIILMKSGKTSCKTVELETSESDTNGQSKDDTNRDEEL